MPSVEILTYVVFGITNVLRKVWRYKRGNQHTSIEEGQTTQWQKNTHTKNYRSSNTNPTKNWDALRWSGMVSISCSTSGICHFTLVTNMVIGHAWRKVYHRQQLQEKTWCYLWKQNVDPHILQSFKNDTL